MKLTKPTVAFFCQILNDCVESVRKGSLTKKHIGTCSTGRHLDAIPYRSDGNLQDDHRMAPILEVYEPTGAFVNFGRAPNSQTIVPKLCREVRRARCWLSQLKYYNLKRNLNNISSF